MSFPAHGEGSTDSTARPPKPWYHKARNRWCCTINGRLYVLAKGRQNRLQAEAEFHRLMVALGRPDPDTGQPYKPSVRDLFEAFLESTCLAVERGDRARITYDSYVRFLSSAVNAFGPTRADALTPHQVHLWCDSQGTNWGTTTRANAITAVKAAFRWGRRRGLLTEDPLRDLEKPTRRRREAVLTDDQIRTVLDATAGTPFADLVLGLWESGCRPSEIATLTADRADPDRGIWLVMNKTRSKTGREFRRVYLTQTLVELTRKLLNKHPSGLLFRNARGNAWTRNAQGCAWRRLRQQLGLGPEATSYAIRHRYARTALERGLPSSDVAALMGHRDSRMVDTVYGGWEEQAERLKDAARRARPNESNSPPIGDDAGRPSRSQSGETDPPLD